MQKTGAPVSSPIVIPVYEAAVLVFLKDHAGIPFTAEDVGRKVRPLIMTPVAGKPVSRDPRVMRSWANALLNKLHRKGLILKTGHRGRGRSITWSAPVLETP